MLEVKIAACPFCGGDGDVKDNGDSAFVRCSQCAARGPMEETPGRAIAEWNQRGKIGQARVALVDPKMPIETFKLLERMRETCDRLERGDLGAADRGALLLMERKILKVVALRMENSELRGVAAAVVSAIDAQNEVLR